jgi:hypothetical protein
MGVGGSSRVERRVGMRMIAPCSIPSNDKHSQPIMRYVHRSVSVCVRACVLLFSMSVMRRTTSELYRAVQDSAAISLGSTTYVWTGQDRIGQRLT